MADRNCKFFSPNYFNPTKCQNCYKAKEQHVQDNQNVVKQPLGTRRSAPLKRNTPPAKTVLKESILLKGQPDQTDQTPGKWEKHWFRLYSNGELQEFSITGGQIDKNTVKNTLLLQEFIRMLDGKLEIAEDLCFGVKTLRNTLYFKTLTRVDYENWWKEFSSFVAAPIRTLNNQETVSSPKTVRGYTRPNFQKQHSSPAAVLLSKTTSRHSRSSSSSSTVTEPDPAEMETLRNQVSKLEEDNTKLSKIEEERRKLELEVNYWKEYVTNAQALKRAGGSLDATTELADTRNKLIQCQDELNETQKRLKLNSGKLLMQNREMNDMKTKLQEANSLVAVYKARIDHMSRESHKDSPVSSPSDKEQLLLTKPSDEMFFIGNTPKPNDSTPPVNSPSPEVMGAQHFEDKFLVLKDRMKRIERELFLKSKELEKANESRSKVAKYTRSLLQELETRLSDTQQKLSESEEKLKHANTELKMERERRIQLEDGPRRRMSSLASPPKNITALEELNEAAIKSSGETPQSSDLTEHDADTKYADYYRARFKEAEEALLEKDKKLHQAEEKIKQIQNSVKTNSDSYKVINELQTKLSDATHKLSDRQLKIHELTREIDRLRGYEKTFQKKTEQCNTLEEIVKDLENKNLEQSQNLHQVKQDLELLKIREVVLKEQLQTLIEDSDDEDEDDEDNNEDEKLGKSIALKNQINNMVELETQVKKLTQDNEKLFIENADLETRIRNANIQHFKTIESGKNCPAEDSEKVDSDIKIKELESKLHASEDRHCSEMSAMKEKHFDDLSSIEKKFKEDTKELNELLAKYKTECESFTQVKGEIEGECDELRGKVTMLNLKIEDFEKKLKEESDARQSAEVSLAESSNLLKAAEERCNRIIVERDSLKNSANESSRNSFGVYDDDSIENDEKLSQLSTENHEMKVRIRQLERKLRVSLERYEDIVASMKEKGIYSEGKDKDRDSGIVITQEIKNLMDSFKKEDIIESMVDGNLDIGNLVNNLQIGIESESGEERYKKLSANLTHVLKDLGKKFILSEQRNLELSTELEQRSDAEDEHVSKYNALLGRVEDLNQQILESQEVLQSKADELERERKNVLNLVEVTSAYIKELEGSLTESKTKIQELQAIAETAGKHQDSRQPPDGSATEVDLDKVDGLSASKPRNERSPSDDIQEKLNAKIMTLESDISVMKRTHEDEIKMIRTQSQHALDQLQQESSSEEKEDLLAKIEALEEELEEQKQNYDKDVAMLTQRFQTELKAAFGNDAGSMDILDRVQELEIEIEQTRKDRDAKLKEVVEQCEKEKQQMKDDMATVLQASLSASLGGDFNGSSTTANSGELSDASAANIEELQDRVIKLEQELMDQQDRYEEELEMEKKAHQTEMEDTIRDMMMVRAATAETDQNEDTNDDTDAEQSVDEGCVEGRVSSSRGSIDQGVKSSKKSYTDADLTAIKEEYEKKMQQKVEEHQEALDQARQDMAIVISSLKQGSSSDTIMDLQGKIKDLEQELEDIRGDYEEQLEELELKFKRSESKNFFALRRNEEMGGKIYQMQNELEELDRKHSLEIQIYQEKLSSLGGGDVDTKALEYVKVNAELEDKVRAMELALNTLRNERDGEMDSFVMSLREEKRAAIEEMTDKVLKLESIIEDMKENHQKEILEYEKLQREQKNEASLKENKRIDELEAAISKLKGDYENEIDELAQEHKKVVEELRVFYEKEIGDIKKRSSSDVDGSSRKQSVDQTTYVKQVTKELKEKHEKEITALKIQFSNEKQIMEDRQQKEIDDIRMQYDEKLKLGYKEGLRRQSLSDRKSDGTRMRELIAQKEQLETKYLELEIKHENDIKALETKNIKLQSLISELKNRLNGDTTDSPYKRREVTSESDRFASMDVDESQKKLKEIQEQIERYERRIEYYREKSQREKTEESHRVSELQSEIVELHKEMNTIKESRRKEVYDKEKKEKVPGEKLSVRRNTDGSLPARRHTDTEAVKPISRPRDPRKRWSNLEERTEKDEGKSGTVSARKSMWESILDEPSSPVTRSNKGQLSKPPSGVR